MYTVHIREKPARRFVALLVCTALLGALTYAAWYYSRTQTEATLGAKVTPTGWPLSFRLPAGWRQVNNWAPDADRQLIYWKDEPRSLPTKLIIRRQAGRAGDTVRRCRESFREYFGVFDIAGVEYDDPIDVSWRELEGSVMAVPQMGYAVFVGAWRTSAAGDEYLIIELAAPNGLTEPEIHFFRGLVESFERM